MEGFWSRFGQHMSKVFPHSDPFKSFYRFEKNIFKYSILYISVVYIFYFNLTEIWIQGLVVARLWVRLLQPGAG